MQSQITQAISIAMPNGAVLTTISAQITVDTVHQVCVRISEATRIPVQRQQLFFAGRQLQHDKRTLSEHGVTGESTLQLVKV